MSLLGSEVAVGVIGCVVLIKTVARRGNGARFASIGVVVGGNSTVSIVAEVCCIGSIESGTTIVGQAIGPIGGKVGGIDVRNGTLIMIHTIASIGEDRAVAHTRRRAK